MRSLTAPLVAASLALATLPAPASDLPTRPAYGSVDGATVANWTGLYGGLHLGYGFGSAGRADLDGFLGGAQLGGNYQIDQFVIGGEIDASFADIDYSGFSDRFAQRWLASARARAGYAFDRFLPYVTGGIAFTGGELKDDIGSADATHTGLILGIGAEMMVTDRISGRIEYLHAWYGAEDYTIGGTSRRIEPDTGSLRIGVNYRF